MARYVLRNIFPSQDLVLGLEEVTLIFGTVILMIQSFLNGYAEF